MIEAELKAIPSAELFGLCVSRFEDERYWEEFVSRFNQSLTRSVYQAYRRLNGRAQPNHWVIGELLQEIYLKILKDKCSSLRHFRGNTDIEAEVYLMHIATSVTIDSLRRQNAIKRHAQTESLEDSDLLKETWALQGSVSGPYTDELAERELIKLLRRTFIGKNSERDILIFLLHFLEGLTPREIATTEICNLKPSSIAHILERMRERMREVLNSGNWAF